MSGAVVERSITRAIASPALSQCRSVKASPPAPREWALTGIELVLCTTASSSAQQSGNSALNPVYSLSHNCKSVGRNRFAITVRVVQQMANSSNSRRDRPQLRSYTWGSLQTLTRALRESLRLRKLRKQKRLRDEENDKHMRRRSKSVGNAYNIDDEISEVGISVAVASDIGPVLNPAKYKEPVMAKRKQSKSVDEIELAQVHRALDIDGRRNLTPSAINGQMRRRSKDDHDLPEKTALKDSQFYLSEQKSLRKRFGRLFGTLQGRRPLHKQLPAQSAPTPSPTTDEETSPEKKKIADKPNETSNDVSNRAVANEEESETNNERNRE